MKKLLAGLLFLAPWIAHSENDQPINIPAIKGGSVTSVFLPDNKIDSLQLKSISIFNEQIKVDLFEGYAVVNAKFWLNNSAQKKIDLEVGIPQEENKFSTVYWLRIDINNRPPIVATDTFADRHWQSWEVNLLPGITEVEMFYGVKTEGASFQAEDKIIHGNCFRYDFSMDHFWGSNSEKSEIWFRMNSGYVTQDVLGLLPNGKFLGGNSILHGWKKDIMQDSAQQVLLWYRSLDSITFIPGRISWEMKYHNLKEWNPNEKNLATLQPFTAMDFEGKALQQQMKAANKIESWKWISGIVITLFVLATFIFTEIRNRKTQ